MARAGVFGIPGLRGMSSGGAALPPSPAVDFYWTAVGGGALGSGTVAATGAVGAYSAALAAMPSSGRYYFEITVTGTAISSYGFSTNVNGVYTANSALWDNADETSILVRYNTSGWWAEKKTVYGTPSENGAPPTYGASQVVSVAWNADTSNIWMAVGGLSWIGGGDPTAGTTPTLGWSTVSQLPLFAMGFNGAHTSTIILPGLHTQTAPTNFTPIGGAA